MIRRSLLPAIVAAVSAWTLPGSASAQPFPEPVTSATEPRPAATEESEAGSVSRPRTDTDEGARSDAQSDQSGVSRKTADRESTGADQQAWSQIASLHLQFVTAQLRGHQSDGEDQPQPVRTAEQRQLQKHWQRLAEIERQLIARMASRQGAGVPTAAIDGPNPERPGTGTRPEAGADLAPIDSGPVPRRDLDLDSDPLNSTNQGLPSSAGRRDKQTARSILQEDRSPAPDPATANNTPEDVATSDDPRPGSAQIVSGRESIVDTDRDLTSDEGLSPENSELWRQYLQVRRQILATEIAIGTASSRQ